MLSEPYARFLEMAASGRALPDDIENVIRWARSTKASPPGVGESTAVAWYSPKTASLFFDRVYGVFHEDMPESIRFGACTDGEFFYERILAMAVCKVCGKDPLRAGDTGGSPENVHQPKGALATGADDTAGSSEDARPLKAAFAHQIHSLEVVCAYRDNLGVQPIPVYPSLACFDAEYRPGNYAVVIAAAENLRVVDEKRLTWEQALCFRQDSDAKRKYRRFVHWLDRDLVGKSLKFIEDEFAIRMEDYEAALKKHGIKAVVGVLSEVLDGKFFAAASGVAGGSWLLTGEPWSAAVAGAALVIGKASVSLAQKLLAREDLVTGPGSEIAYIHDIRTRLGQHRRDET